MTDIPKREAGSVWRTIAQKSGTPEFAAADTNAIRAGVCRLKSSRGHLEPGQQG